MHEDSFEWEVPEHEQSHKTWDWYVTVPTIFISLVVVSFFFENYLFAVFVLIAGFALVFYAHRDPDILNVTIGERGVRINDSFYPFSSLTAFAFEEKEGHDLLLLRSERFFAPLITIPIPHSIDIEDVADFLLDFLDEEELFEPLSQKIMEYLGF